jgi:hypothetical protein
MRRGDVICIAPFFVLNIRMLISKHIQSQYLKNYFLVKGKFEINSKYFIEKIEEGIKDSQMNFKTHVKGFMTPWKYFIHDNEIYNHLFKIFDFIDKNLNAPPYTLVDIWGFKHVTGSKTTEHDHIPSLYSGVIYLTEGEDLYFPEIKETVKCEPGSFAIFSADLKHGCERNLSNNPRYGISFNLMDNGQLGNGATHGNPFDT